MTRLSYRPAAMKDEAARALKKTKAGASVKEILAKYDGSMPMPRLVKTSYNCVIQYNI